MVESRSGTTGINGPIELGKQKVISYKFITEGSIEENNGSAGKKMDLFNTNQSQEHKQRRLGIARLKS